MREREETKVTQAASPFQALEVAERGRSANVVGRLSTSCGRLAT
jgi:hypothetical protein